MCKVILESPFYYKAALNVIYSKILWPAYFKEWKDSSHIIHGMSGFSDTWYSVREFSLKRKRLEHKVWDGTHLVTNMRRVVCTEGTDLLSKNAWLAASQYRTVKLKYAMVTDLPDKQDKGFAITTFSEVEDAMIKENYHKEAKFCRLLRNWWEAEDEPGIPAMERLKSRLELRQYVLANVDSGDFLPFTDYVKGM